MDIRLATVFASTTLPPKAMPGYFDDFNRANGPVGYTTAERRPWSSKSLPANSTPIPLLVDAGAARRGAGGTATRSIWAPEAYAANGVLTARIKNLGDATGALALRAVDADNCIILSCRADDKIKQYRLQQRLNGDQTTLASSGSVESVTGDVVQVILDGPSVTVLINGAVIFGGPRPVNNFLGATSHGLLLYSSSSGNETWDSIGFATAA